MSFFFHSHIIKALFNSCQSKDSEKKSVLRKDFFWHLYVTSYVMWRKHFNESNWFLKENNVSVFGHLRKWMLLFSSTLICWMIPNIVCIETWWKVRLFYNTASFIHVYTTKTQGLVFAQLISVEAWHALCRTHFTPKSCCEIEALNTKQCSLEVGIHFWI